MFILGAICCRAGSKGVKDKNIKCLDGKPLISYTIETALQCELLDDITVSTDSETVMKMAEQYEIKNIFKRPAELATDTASKWNVFIHLLETYEMRSGIKIDYIVDMDVTVPLKTREDIEGAIQTAIKNPVADVIITGYEPDRNPYFNMVEIGDDGFAHIVKQPHESIVSRQDAPVVYSLTPAAYVIKKEALYKYEHWSKAKCIIHPVPRERAIDIDTEMDFKIVEFFYHADKILEFVNVRQ